MLHLKLVIFKELGIKNIKPSNFDVFLQIMEVSV